MNFNNLKDKFVKSIDKVQQKINDIDINQMKENIKTKVLEQNTNEVPIDQIEKLPEEQVIPVETPKFDDIDIPEEKKVDPEEEEYEYEETDDYEEQEEEINGDENRVNELLKGIKDIGKQGSEQRAQKKLQDKYLD